MLCLADFTIDSDLCLAEGVDPLQFESPDGTLSLTLSNSTHKPEEPAAVLSGQLLFETEKLDEGTREIACDNLVHALNFLSYTTNRKFVQRTLKRIIDWTPGIMTRKAMIYEEIPEWDVAEPGLDRSHVRTAQRLFAMRGGEAQTAAMRWYRLAIEAAVPEEQFAYFWFALEIAAQTLKESRKVASRCPRCQSDLYCEKCGDYPLHRPYPGQAIQQLIERVHPDNATEVFETLQTIRHALMHGGLIEMIDGLPCTQDKAVTKLASVAWKSIQLLFNYGADPDPQETLSLGYVDNMLRRTLIVSVVVETKLKPGGDPDNPRLEDFPEFEVREVK